MKKGKKKGMYLDERDELLLLLLLLFLLRSLRTGPADFVISGPHNPRHQLHVDQEYNWSGSNQNPEEAFQIVEKIGQGYELLSLLDIIFITFKVLSKPSDVLVSSVLMLQYTKRFIRRPTGLLLSRL